MNMAKYPIKIDKLKVGELITEPFDYEISFKSLIKEKDSSAYLIEFKHKAQDDWYAIYKIYKANQEPQYYIIDNLIGDELYNINPYEISFDYADGYGDIRESFIKKHL